MRRLFAFSLFIVGMNCYALTPQQQQLLEVQKTEQVAQQQLELQKQNEKRVLYEQEQARRAANAKAANAARLRREKRQAIRNKQIEAEIQQDKVENDYANRLRELKLKQLELQVQEQEARVARSKDFIDQDLKRKQAETDVIQSQADATRNVSEGDKNLATSTGTALENKSKGWFN